jgi:hypothetical protein
MKNVGGIDRTLRIVVGAGLVGYGAYGAFMATPAGESVAMTNWILMAVGVVPLMTGLMNFCLAYTLFGISTCKNK